MFKSKQKQLEALMAAYRDKVADCIKEFSHGFREYSRCNEPQVLQEGVTRVHKAESEADDLRREIENMMYSRALFPESRGDILGLLETMDEVPNRAERIMFSLQNQRITVPDALHTRLVSLLDICVRCVEVMLEAIEKLFSDYTAATAMTGRMDELESEADTLESLLILNVFEDETLPDLDKILLRDLVRDLSGITDQVEKVGDRIRLIIVKRMI